MVPTYVLNISRWFYSTYLINWITCVFLKLNRLNIISGVFKSLNSNFLLISNTLLWFDWIEIASLEKIRNANRNNLMQRMFAFIPNCPYYQNRMFVNPTKIQTHAQIIQQSHSAPWLCCCKSITVYAPVYTIIEKIDNKNGSLPISNIHNPLNYTIQNGNANPHALHSTDIKVSSCNRIL